MQGFIDIHTHILPGVDDGAQDMSEALQMLHTAWENGTKAVFLTPHYRSIYKQSTPDMLKETFARLQETALSQLPEMQLYLGQEISYDNDAPESIYENKVLRLNNSHYALLEFRSNTLPSQMINGVTKTIYNGFVPIIAHVERCNAVRKDSKFLDELLHAGALLQLNADSILGKNGFAVKHFCHKILSSKKPHFVASDAHDGKLRPPVLQECFRKVCKKYGAQYAASLFRENSLRVIEDGIIE